MNYLPKNYEIPQGKSNYYKLEKGSNKFRIVSKPILGYLYWNNDNKPIRMKEYPSDLPLDIRVEEGQTPESNIKHFWALTVIDRDDNGIKVFEITQKSIMRSLKALFDNEDWGDPSGYDITVTREGDKLLTKYEIHPSPPKPLTKEDERMVKDTPVELEQLYVSGDPFGSTKKESNEKPEEIKIEDIEF